MIGKVHRHIRRSCPCKSGLLTALDCIDIYSFALTALSSLLRNYSIDPNSIGRLEVGTETLLDKSKSVKSVLMSLFEPSGNTNIEGVDTVNACYGGTNAIFNAVNWVESSAWDGRDAIVIAGDIALYKKGNARPTGGAGCVAMLIGPDAPIVMEPGMHGSYMKHAYDFYKADLTSEYPIVDGHYSLRCYSEALDACYKNYNNRELKLAKSKNSAVNGEAVNGHSVQLNGTPVSDVSSLATPLDRFDYVAFHSPTCKTVAKSYARMLYQDFLANPSNELFAEVPTEIRSLSYEASLTDKNLEKTFLGLTKQRFTQRVQPGIEMPTMCGNMYCASVHGCLISVLSNTKSADLLGKRVALFSYGSGLASSLFSVKIVGDTSKISEVCDMHGKLNARRTVPPTVYDEVRRKDCVRGIGD